MEFALTAFEVFRYAISLFLSHRVSPAIACLVHPAYPTSHLRRKARSDLLLPVPSEDGNQAAGSPWVITSQMICPSGLVPGKGSTTAFTRWMRRSPLVKVPLFSRKDEAGKMTSACLVVLGMGRSPGSPAGRGCRAPSSPAGCSGRFCTTSSPISHKAFRLPFKRFIPHLRNFQSFTYRHGATVMQFVFLVHLRVVGTVSCSR